MMRTWTSSCLANRSRAFSISKGSPSRVPPNALARRAWIADGASVAQGILEFPYPLFGLALCAFFGPFRERSSRMD
jgi:hypothetical protein